MASYTCLSVAGAGPVGDLWEHYADQAGPANWLVSVPPPKDPIIVTVSVPSGQVCFG